MAAADSVFAFRLAPATHGSETHAGEGGEGMCSIPACRTAGTETASGIRRRTGGRMTANTSERDGHRYRESWVTVGVGECCLILPAPTGRRTSVNVAKRSQDVIKCNQNATEQHPIGEKLRCPHFSPKLLKFDVISNFYGNAW